MADKKRYTDEELEEFRAIINEKLRLARRDFTAMMKQIMNADGNDVDDTSPTYKTLEEGSASQTKEETGADGKPSTEIYSRSGGCPRAHTEQNLWH